LYFSKVFDLTTLVTIILLFTFSLARLDRVSVFIIVALLVAFFLITVFLLIVLLVVVLIIFALLFAVIFFFTGGWSFSTVWRNVLALSRIVELIYRAL
jgi:hypothetical protein